MKMRIILLCLFCIFTTVVFAQEKYSIKGIANKEMNGTRIGLYQLEDGQRVVETLLDSTVVKKEKFTFSGTVGSPRIAIIKRLNDKEELSPVILEKGKITVDIVASRCGGTSLNDTLDIACLKMKSVLAEMKRLDKKSRDAVESIKPEDRLDKTKFDSIFHTVIKKNIDTTLLLRDSILLCVNPHKNSLVGVYLFSRLGGSAFYYDVNKMKEDASPIFLDHPLVIESIKRQELYLQRLKEEAEKRMSKEEIELREKRAQMEAKIKIGEYFPDAKVKDKSGKLVTFSDYVGKGKYVLIDFWASWCGPCRREMPNVKAAYEKYASKGFEVISISTDSKQKDWEDAVQELGMTWTQLLDVDAADIYGVFAIPTTFLVDPKGYVIEKNLRGKKLEEVLSKLIR